MKLLLDSHTFLWSLGGGPLSEAAAWAIMDADNDLFLSAASYWEICLKLSIGKLALAENWAEQFDIEMAANGIVWLPVAPEHCRRIIELPAIHQDPFDRLLVAQALCEELVILTSDRRIWSYPVNTLW